MTYKLWEVTDRLLRKHVETSGDWLLLNLNGGQLCRSWIGNDGKAKHVDNIALKYKRLVKKDDGRAERMGVFSVESVPRVPAQACGNDRMGLSRELAGWPSKPKAGQTDKLREHTGRPGCQYLYFITSRATDLHASGYR